MALVLRTALQAGMIVLKIGGRLPQIIMNWQRGDSGQLSGLMCGLNLAGNLARVFTTAVLTKVGKLLTLVHYRVPLSVHVIP